ncbi:L-amino acid N-acyltransferase YncA [Geodermatophilus tzadiensis]|uniref:L-amino acid N-acyltransferase YncA n=1 Tax=Geodermatophilus tzadiensis TaxID=1137988 RepID=A0A2T0TSN8_9ACTN|nr:GNAT family N-acetyltransferase [Geodermatophilus tzadiensis]PRY48726.1 L-amino acid N-acyltransferase YncA [Geodermatophilus tzadiensis]
MRAEGVRLRDATAGDAPALTDALFCAVTWQGTARLTRDDIAADPRLAHYVAGWPRPGDLGVVAVVAGGEPVGAAWCRTFPAGDPGYGFVAEDVPEVSMGVAPARRGQGIGTAMLDGLVARARETGARALSLSVEDGNRARVLYERAGFVVVGRLGDSDVMLLDLRRPVPCRTAPGNARRGSPGRGGGRTAP